MLPEQQRTSKVFLKQEALTLLTGNLEELTKLNVGREANDAAIGDSAHQD